MEAIEKLETFFELDLKIKKMIEISKPNLYDIDPVIEEEKLLKTIQISRTIINKMTNIYFENFKNSFNDRIDEIENEIKNCNYKPNRLLEVYEDDFLILKEDLLKSLYDNVQGYKYEIDYQSILAKCTSINEMIHVIHFCVINNDNILNSINKIEEKKNEENKKVVLYGKENKISRNIYNKFNDKYSDRTDIVSFDNHVLMMVRDRGHALTINIENENDYLRVSYFIPKVNNIKMVSKLPGIGKLKSNISNSDFASGEFIVQKDEIGETINNFVSKVPTDLDNPDIAKFSNDTKEETPHIKI